MRQPSQRDTLHTGGGTGRKGAGMGKENGASAAHKARAEREANGVIEYLLLLALVSVGAVGGLTLLAAAISRCYLDIAPRLVIP